ncbi:MAG: antirestriction protein ArdA [Pseudomonadota bacterium]
MNTVLYAQPYDLSATGFSFEDAEDYATKAAACRNAYGGRVEEFEIQFIDGEAINAQLAEAVGLHQGGIAVFFQAIADWDERDKLAVIIAVGECGYVFDWASSAPGDFDVDIYEGMSLEDLAEEFVDQGLFGEIPKLLQSYLDYDAIARDLAMDYTEAEVAGMRLVYRCS